MARRHIRTRYAGKEMAVPHRAIRAYQLFKHGLDTLEIANQLGVGFTEAHALKLVSIGRSHMLGKPSPYQGAR